jgi:type VI secretion system protein ImpL
MRVLRNIFTNWWVLSILTAILLLLLLVLLLPFLVDAFSPVSVRIAFSILIVLGWVALATWRIISRRQAAGRLATSIKAVAPEGEGATLARRMGEALAEAKRLNGRGDYLYGRPWYVIIGPPGAGKTTALTHSGLRFLTDAQAASNIGGTRNIDFLFTDEAVLIDTAGRYTSQDSDSARDRAAWKKFLELLRKNRPLQPVNGVLVALAIDELSKADPVALDTHARIVRDRLRELQGELSLQLPVYVLFTKCDLLAGFSEFFDDLDVEGRRAVLGSTFDWPGSSQPDEAAWARSFDELSDAIDARMAKRLQEELDGRRRSLIVGFPVQIAALRSRLVYFLSRAFASEDIENPNWPRGFYFTSGVQQGTPFDRVLGSLAAVYDAPQTASAQGRSYFVNRLLKEVVIGEAGLGKRSSKVYARERALLIGGLAAMAVLCVLLGILWTVSYVENRSYQDRLLVAALHADQIQKQSNLSLTEVSDLDPGPEQGVALLDALRALPGGYEERRTKGRSLWAAFGLYQSNLADLAEDIYLEDAQRILLPRILFRLEQKLSAGRADLQAEYNALKVYLIMGGYHPDSDNIRLWTIDDWQNEEFRGPDEKPTLDDLTLHLNAMFADSDINSAWGEDGRAPLDPGLVARGRSDIESLSFSERAYAILKADPATRGEGWSPGKVLLQGGERSFANGDAFAAMTVPFLFTKNGYVRAYLAQIPDVEGQLRADAWMLGDENKKESFASQFGELHGGVAHLYAADYISHWSAVLHAMRPANYFSDPKSYPSSMAGDSPIKQVLRDVVANTSFKAGGMAKTVSRLSSLAPSLSRYTRFLPNGGGSGGEDAGSIIDSAFRDLHEYYAHGLDDYLNKLASAREKAVEARPDGGAPDPMAQADAKRAMNDLKAAAQGNAPPVLQAFLNAAAQQGAHEQESTYKTSLADTYSQSVKPDCIRATQDRYPFRQDGSVDANPDDITNVFGQHGEIDAFVASPAGLQPYIDSSGAVWHWRTGAAVTSGFSPQTPEEFQKASNIGELLGASGVQAGVAVKEFGGEVTAAELTVGDRVLKFEKGGGARPEKMNFSWTVGIEPDAKIVLYSSAPSKSAANSTSNDSKDKSSGATGDSATAKQDDAQPQISDSMSEEGKWAVFKLFDKAKIEQHTEKDFDATFGGPVNFVTFHITVSSSSRSPFGHPNTLWSFRCPAAL